MAETCGERCAGRCAGRRGKVRADGRVLVLSECRVRGCHCVIISVTPDQFKTRHKLEGVILQRFEVLDQILAGQTYLVDEEISAADIAVACEATQVAIAPVDVSSFQNVARWLKLLGEREAFATAHQWFNKEFKTEMHYRVATLYL